MPPEDFLPMLTFLTRSAKKLYMSIASQGNVHIAREELDFFQLMEMSHPVFRNIPESKQAINVIQPMVPQLALQDLNPI